MLLDIGTEVLADAIPHSVWVTSAAGAVEYANRRAAQFPGGDLGRILHPGDLVTLTAAARPDDQPYEVECRLAAADGTFRRHRLHFAPAGGGPATRWIVTGTDIENHAAPEDETARIPFRSAVIDDIPGGLYTVDGDGRLTSLNRAASELLGWTEEELLGVSVHSVVHACVRQEAPLPQGECRLRPVRMADRSGQSVECTFVRRDGLTFPVACSVAPFETGDGAPGTVVTFHDLTQARNAEVEARHDQKLESLGRLSAGLAHEINTPIQFVGDNTRFLAEAYQDMLELLLVYRECMAPSLGELEWAERTRRAQAAEIKADIDYLATEIPAAVGQSLEGVERVASLVKAMKSFGYKDSTEQSYADLNEAIRTTLTVARNEVKYVADVILDLGEIPDVLCHRGDLNQVFLNLLVNAADALTDKGERGEIRISSVVDGPTVVITFADNGPGIPPHIQQSVFEPFFTTKEVGKGTGQGLALARSVLEKHSGSIEVRSVTGEGTEFVVRLPVAGRQRTPA
jgi:two-component system NtrC family sensor kinase